MPRKPIDKGQALEDLSCSSNKQEDFVRNPQECDGEQG